MRQIYRVLGLFLVTMSAGTVWADSFEVIRQLAEQGNSQGQAKLASLYLLGREGVEKDEKQAALWMEKAANQGLVDAQVVMGAMYDRGLGVIADRDKATQWYEKAPLPRGMVLRWPFWAKMMPPKAVCNSIIRPCV